MRNVNARDACRETVNDVVEHAERGEPFSRKLSCVHLLEVVRDDVLV